MTALTRRGRAVLAVVAVGLVLGHAFGGRSLNAVVVPAAVLLVATRLYVRTVPEPSVERTAPRDGHRGGRGTVKLVVDAARAYPATVRDVLGDGLRGDAERPTTVDGRTVTYDVEFSERGVHTVGPCRVRATDPFGLWTVDFEAGSAHRVTVFPRVRELRGTAPSLSRHVEVPDAREQFAGVREYERGDPLRDVNWKASAKRPDGLAVTEYTGTGIGDGVTVAAEAVGSRADDVAEAAASVAVHLLDAGVAVGVTTGSERVDPGSSGTQRRRVLDALASFEPERLGSERTGDADVVVRASPHSDHVTVAVDGDERRFEEFVGGTTREGRTGRSEVGVP